MGLERTGKSWNKVGSFKENISTPVNLYEAHFVANVIREQTRVIQNPFNIWYSILLKDKNLL